MESVGILVVSYGSRAASFVDAFSRSVNYTVKLFIADKQANPFNLERAEKHVVIPDLNSENILDFVKDNKNSIDFGIVGPEGPIIAGVRDLIEKETGIPIICPTKEFALEESKLRQRLLLKECCPEANPRFRVFNRNENGSASEVKGELWSWLDDLNNEVAVKPDRPGYGKGVGVWGDHFQSREELFQHFLSIYEHDSVILEEKIDGEESSFQGFCDGRNLIALPDTRDYKRAFENDEGANTGGMGCYKAKEDYLPFMNPSDREKEVEIVNKIFKKLKGEGNPGLRGIPLYVAFMHSAQGPKILEINSRGGDPEIQTLMPLIEDDFVDICYKMIEGNLGSIRLNSNSSVLIYKAPPNYGSYRERFPDRVNENETGTPVNLSKANNLAEKYGDNLRIYPGSMELRDGKNYALGSRTVCCIGIADSIEAAREISLEGINSITGGALWYRKDIASREHIQRSVEHMGELME